MWSGRRSQMRGMPASSSAHLGPLHRILLILATASELLAPRAAAAGAAVGRSTAAHGTIHGTWVWGGKMVIPMKRRGPSDVRPLSSSSSSSSSSCKVVLYLRGGGAGAGRGDDVDYDGAAQSSSCLGSCFGLCSQSINKGVACDGGSDNMLAAAAAGSQGRMLAGAAIAWGIASAFSAGRKSDQGDRFGVEKREAQEQRSLLENALRARRFLVQDVEARSRAGVGGGRGRGWGRGREHEAMVERDREQIKSLSFLIGIGVVQESLSFVGRAAFALLTLFQRKGDEDEAALD